VTVVGDGNAAFAAFQRQRFDVVLMDVQMPHKNGLEATAAIRAQEAVTGKHLPIIALTAHAMKGDRERCLSAGMDAYISKPIRSKELFETIESVLHGNSAEPGSPRKNQDSGEVPSQAPFDEALLLERTEGNPELCELLVGTFLKEYPAQVTTLRQALDQKDTKQIASAAHALKGAIANFTDGSALRATKVLEKVSREGNLPGAFEAYQKLTSELDRMQAALNEFIHRQRGLKAKGQAAN